MRRRIRWLGVVMVLCFGLIVVQLVNIQFVKAHQLATSPNNPRVAVLKYDNPRGTIYAADGTTVLAKSVATTPGPYKYPYSYLRQYPQGPLYAGITGYYSPLYYGTAGIEEEYNSQLSAHSQGAQNLSQLIFGEKIPSVTDDVTLTVQPSLQQAAWNALTTLPPGDNKDGAVVVLQPSTGDVEAMVSNPTYDPNALVSPNLAQRSSRRIRTTTPRTTRDSSRCNRSRQGTGSHRGRRSKWSPARLPTTSHRSWRTSTTRCSGARHSPTRTCPCVTRAAPCGGTMIVHAPRIV